MNVGMKADQTRERIMDHVRACGSAGCTQVELFAVFRRGAKGITSHVRALAAEGLLQKSAERGKSSRVYVPEFAPKATNVQVLLDYIAENPGTVGRDVIKATGIEYAIARSYLRRLVDSSRIASSTGGPSLLARYYPKGEAPADVDPEEADPYASKPFTHRVIPASQAEPLKPRGVRFVFELAEAAA